MKLLNHLLLSISFLIFHSNEIVAVEASVNYVCLYNDGDSYVEIYTRFISDKTEYQINDLTGEYYVDLEMLLVLKIGEEIIEADKYKISSPKLLVKTDFWDLKRFALEDGSYTLEITISNLSIESDPSFRHKLKFITKSATGSASLSEPLILSAFSNNFSASLPFEKYGLFYEPLAFNIITEDQNRVSFLQEIYYWDDKFVYPHYISYAIIELIDEKEVQNKIAYKRFEEAEFKALMLHMDIQDISSGNYILEVEIRDRDKQLIDKSRKSFAIYNPLNDIRHQSDLNKDYENSFVQLMTKSELEYSLKAIYPQVGQDRSEILNKIITSDDIKAKKFYLFSYWSQIAPQDPELVYNKYMEVVSAVDEKYASQLGMGFETDRGYIFMKYGKPNDVISVEDEPSAPPYEIWVYEHIPLTKQSVVKFLFYNPSLGHNDFELLHSTCRGERNNPQWELDLYKDALSENADNDFDRTTMKKNWNRQARQYFEDY